MEPVWLTAFRNITNVTNERTMVGAALGNSGVGNSAPLYDVSPRMAAAAAMLLADFDSLVFDWTARLFVGGTNLNFYIVRQFPVLEPTAFLEDGPSCRTYAEFLAPRVLELAYTAWDLEPFARDLGYDAPPFLWNEERRFLIRCELDAAFFHLYLPAAANGEWRMASREDGAVVDETPEQLAALKEHFPTPRDAVAHIMDTFPIVRRKDVAEHGHYRTKDTILEIYDDMAAAIAAASREERAASRERPATEERTPSAPTPSLSASYQTRLNPPAGPPCDAEGNFIPMSEWDPAHWPPHIHRPRQRENSDAV